MKQNQSNNKSYPAQITADRSFHFFYSELTIQQSSCMGTGALPPSVPEKDVTKDSSYHKTNKQQAVTAMSPGILAAYNLKNKISNGRETKMRTTNLHTHCLKIASVFFLMLFAFSNSYSQYQIKHYDVGCLPTSNGQDFGRAIINRIDNGYAIAGYTYQNPSCIGNYDWLFMKLNPNGTVDCGRILGMQKDDKAYSLEQSVIDSSYFLAGYVSNMNSPFRKKATISRVDKNCNLTYTRGIMDTLNSTYYQIERDPFTRFGLSGFQETQVTVGYLRNKILAAQYLPNGVLVWANKYVSGGLSTEEAYSLAYQPVGTCYGLTAKTNFFTGSTANNDVMIVKLDYLGNVVWKKVYKVPSSSTTFIPNTEPRKIIAMPDGGFVVTGFTNVLGSTDRDVFVLRVSSNGLLNWSATYGSAGMYEEGQSIALDNNTLVITGSERMVSPAGSPNAFILKIPVGGGAPLFHKTWDSSNPTDAGFDIIRSATGAPNGYALTGHTYRGAFFNDVFLWRSDVNGNIPGSTCYDSLATYYKKLSPKLDSFTLNKVQLLDVTRPMTQVIPSGDVTTLCFSTTGGHMPKGENTDENIREENNNMKEESKGEFTEKENNSEVSEVKEFNLNQNSPNPFNPVTSINFELPVASFTTLRVYDMTGRLVSTLVNEFKPAGFHSTTFDGSRLSSGAYYYKIEAEGFTAIKKMMLIK